MKPLAVDLCCGLGGWTEGLLAEGWDVVGFDCERHVYGESRYPAQLVLQDIRTLDGRQFLGKVSLIVASPPCQRFSYMAMPWTRAKALIPWYRDPAHPERLRELTELVTACFRIAREAECPIVLENVRGAQPWIGKAKWLYGSFALWGDVPALMPITRHRGKGPKPGTGDQFCAIRLDQIKNDGDSWFNVAHNTTSGTGNNARDVLAAGIKRPDGGSWSWFGDYAEQKARGTISPGRQYGSKTPASKAASAHIAKIPLPLAAWIARAWWPENGHERVAERCTFWAP